MLIGLSPLLHPDLLHALASMGHGDSVVIADANFPAASVGADTALGLPLEVGADALTTLRAVLTVLPVDTFDPDRPPVLGMQVVGDPDAVPEIVAEAEPLLKQHGTTTALIERYAFYAAARDAFAVIRTTETRLYGNFILRKGVVAPDA